MTKISVIKVRKVDSKGRVTLPQKNLSEVFIIEYNDLMILGKSEEDLDSIIDMIDEKNRHIKIKALQEWEDLLEEADLLDMSTDKIDQAIIDSQKKKIFSVLDDEVN